MCPSLTPSSSPPARERSQKKSALRITLSNGAQGYGEAAPFPEVGGETREGCLTSLRQLCKAVFGRPAAATTRKSGCGCLNRRSLILPPVADLKPPSSMPTPER